MHETREIVHFFIFQLLGGTAYSVAVILGITSLPSVSSSMSWREFRLIQSRLGWICLVLASLHVVFSAWSVSKFFGFSCFFPSPALVGIFLPALTIITKIPLLVFDPCLTKIRSGQNARAFCG